jgi:mannose-6-phosphate isomerase
MEHMDLLTNAIQPYAWGSRTAIAELQGRVPDGGPEAELWMGAHPGAPSGLDRSPSLLTAIEEDPGRELGAQVLDAFGPRLPYLLKVLAADKPLSLQVHPTPQQARAGFDAEEAAGVPRGAAERNYKDPYSKPELIVALTPFTGLCGFRDVAELAALLEELAVPALKDLTQDLSARADEATLRATLAALLQWPQDERAGLVAEVVAACRQAPADSRFGDSYRWAAKVAVDYPGDTGVVVVLMLNLVELQPGEAVFLRPRTLHAYLQGVGVEIMAGSDNVLRCGLTPKHIDVDELLSLLDFGNGPIAPTPAAALSPYERAWNTPTPEFRLSEVTPGHDSVQLTAGVPQILLCIAGSAHIADASGSVDLSPGTSVFVPASSGPVTVSGDAHVFRAIPGL